MVNYTAKVLIPFKQVGVDALLFFPLIGVSALLLKRVLAFLPFTGVSLKA